MADYNLQQEGRAQAIATRGLGEINALFSEDGVNKSPRIDEMIVMGFQNGDGDVIFSLTRDSVVDISTIWPLIASSDGAKHGEVIELAGQAGEDFDFMVVIEHEKIEYFVFGNYLDGELEDLMAHEEWGVARAMFIALAMSVVKALIP